jgi:hypothetical protein
MTTPDHHMPTPAGLLTEALGGRFNILGIVTKITATLEPGETALLARTIEEVAQRQVVRYGAAIDAAGQERRLLLQRLMDERWGKVTSHG